MSAQYVTFTPDELMALDLESSKVIDLEMFVPRGEVDPVYFNSPYYLYPDGQMALEAIRVIGQRWLMQGSSESGA